MNDNDELKISEFTEEDEQYFRENGCSENFLQILIDRINIKNEKDVKLFIKKIEEYEKNNILSSFEEEIIVMIKREFYMEPFLGSEDLDNNIRISEYQYNGDSFTSNGYEFYTDDGRRY